MNRDRGNIVNTNLWKPLFRKINMVTAMGFEPTTTLLANVWLNGRVSFYEISGCRFESRCCHLSACFEQGVP